MKRSEKRPSVQTHPGGTSQEDRTGTSIKKIVQTLRAARSATIEVNGQHLTLEPDLTPAARDLLTQLETGH